MSSGRLSCSSRASCCRPGGRAVVEVMLHEAAHALAARRGIKDISAAGNRYHNKRFVALAAELGLRGPDVPDKITGWSHCTLTGQAAYDGYADVAAGINNARLPFLADRQPGQPRRRRRGPGRRRDRHAQNAADGRSRPSARACPSPGASPSRPCRLNPGQSPPPVFRHIEGETRPLPTDQMRNRESPPASRPAVKAHPPDRAAPGRSCPAAVSSQANSSDETREARHACETPESPTVSAIMSIPEEGCCRVPSTGGCRRQVCPGSAGRHPSEPPRHQ
jgi:hypothetical protein